MKMSVWPVRSASGAPAMREDIILARLIAGDAVAVDDQEDLAGKIARVGREPDRLAGAETGERRGEIVVEARGRTGCRSAIAAAKPATVPGRSIRSAAGSKSASVS